MNSPAPIQPAPAGSRNSFWPKARLYAALYLLVLPTTLSLLIFSYYPKYDVIVKAFYRWQPPVINEFVGWLNFKEALTDPQFLDSFKLVGILLVANLLKLWPGILAAIALHRVKSNRLRYAIQVGFVMPMIVPGMVFLLIWKSFYEPDYGLVNRTLNLTGGMQLLNWLDTALPALAAALRPIETMVISPVFGGIGGLIVLGAFIFALSARRDHGPGRLVDYGLIMVGGLIVPAALLAWETFGGSMAVLLICFLFAIAWMVVIAKRLGASWIAWPFLILAGVGTFHGEIWRLPCSLAAALAVFELLRLGRSSYDARPMLHGLAYTLIGVGAFLLLFGNIWTTPLEQFADGRPAWLGNQNLVIPALIFWGFPWVGTVGVLIYLSGLQAISQDVYEAATIDGIGPLGMIFRIELPLIMTQVRINLIFLTIGTLTGYEMFLILLGPDGGPGNRGMVPGLYLFSSAFSEGRFGYACALGMVLFVIIMLLTIVYQKYVKVDK